MGFKIYICILLNVYVGDKYTFASGIVTCHIVTFSEKVGPPSSCKQSSKSATSIVYKWHSSDKKRISRTTSLASQGPNLLRIRPNELNKIKIGLLNNVTILY